MKTYFYIIERDGQIHEIEFTQVRFTESMKQWQAGGLIAFPFLGMMLNSADIVKILSMDQYQNFIDSARPKMFIKNGTWYESREPNTPVRHEPWKEALIEEQKKLALSAPEVKPLSKPEITKLFRKYRPEFMKKDVVNKMRVDMKN